MKVIRFILGLAGFIVVWVSVAALIALAVHSICLGAGGQFPGVHWAGIPGSIVGVVVGFRVYQMISGDRPGKAAKVPKQTTGVNTAGRRR